MDTTTNTAADFLARAKDAPAIAQATIRGVITSDTRTAWRIVRAAARGEPVPVPVDLRVGDWIGAIG